MKYIITLKRRLLEKRSTYQILPESVRPNNEKIKTILQPPRRAKEGAHRDPCHPNIAFAD